MTIDSNILLESGTNELEIIEFDIYDYRYGINVLKVREIILPIPITPIPQSHPNILGIIQLRGEILPVVNLEKALNVPATYEINDEDKKFIVAEFNQQKIVFQVHNVNKIHRISWEQIEKPASLYTEENSHVIGVIKWEESMLLLLDFEKIAVDINPETGINVQRVKTLGERERSNKKIVVAEDSPLLRKLLLETLDTAGYGNVTFFENGQEALDYLLNIVEEKGNVFEEVQLLITDIEMPQMDGHHLTRRLKEDDRTKDLPIIIFSSLITDELRHKGEQVGAVAQVSKPEIDRLVVKIDENIL